MSSSPSINPADGAELTNAPEGVFAGRMDHYNGVTVDPASFKSHSVAEFALALRRSLDYWRSIDRRGLWLKLPVENLEFSAEVRDQGFQLHHAQSEYVMFTKWLGKGVSRLPAYATTHLGVGGVVINEKNQILAIREKNGPFTKYWKVPGGAVDESEDLVDAVLREVREETGIQAEFHSILGFRHLTDYRFTRGDIYFVCRLSVTQTEQSPTACPDEIAEARWMDLEEFKSHNVFRQNTVMGRIYECVFAHLEGNCAGLRAEKLPNGVRRGESFIYYPNFSQQSSK